MANVKIVFQVTIEQQTKDGCGNDVKPVSPGELRSAIVKGLSERNVQSVYVG